PVVHHRDVVHAAVGSQADDEGDGAVLADLLDDQRLAEGRRAARRREDDVALLPQRGTDAVEAGAHALAKRRRGLDLGARGMVGGRKHRGPRLLLAQQDALLRPAPGGRGQDHRREAGETHRRSPPAGPPPETSCASRPSGGWSRRRHFPTPATTSAATRTPWAARDSSVGKMPSTGTRGTNGTGVTPMTPASCSSKTPRPAKTIAIA